MDKETSEIVKLTERISKDPKSKLFVPLAEEYKKAGDVEMAIHVLTEGLKHNPGYVTARSILGRLLLEQGDLLGSQRELEEVVKVIPDNLLAQRKLGDICVLQNRQQEALKYYQAVLLLNPKDEEIAALVTAIKAGADVSQKVAAPKMKVSAAQPIKQDEKPKTQAAPSQPIAEKKPAPVDINTAPPVRPEAAKVEQVEKKNVPPAEAAPMPAAAETADEASVTLESADEPEEIFAVEPLEEHEKAEEPALSVAEPQLSANPDPLSEVSFASDAEKMFAGVTEEVAAIPQTEEEPQNIAPAKEEFTADDAWMQTAAEPEKADEEEPKEKSDDFTTDTLAELYISQGFYEKAIDIYERMFSENPGSRGLKEKLERVKAMAAASSTPPAQAVEATPVDIFAEPTLYSAQEEPQKPKPERFPEPSAAHPGAPPKEWPAAVAEEPVLAPETKQVPPPVFADFEPREYTPPQTAAPVEPELEPVVKKTVTEEHAVKSPTEIRKDTIDRLESWLKNIKKEQ